MISGWSYGLRSRWRLVSGSWYANQPAYDKTTIDYDMARQLYRNDGADTNLGAGFCRPIIDRAVEFVGMPIVSSDDETVDQDVNRAVDRFWRPQLIEMFRNAMRDSETCVRVWSPFVDDPLTTDEERQAGCLTIIDPERVTAVYDPRNPKRITQAVIVSKVDMLDNIDPMDAPRGSKPKKKEHEIWEVITPDSYRYFDRTDQKWLDDWQTDNPDGFVPIVRVYNEYDSTLSGGQSDLESAYPFIKAFHEALRQTLQAHKYHSVPKLKFKTADILGFLKNNFPETIGEDGQPVPVSKECCRATGR
jgi:hypothetical protein